MMKFFAFQLHHGDRLVAEAPLIVHDLDAAIEITEQCICSGDPVARTRAADVLALLVGLRNAQARAADGTFTGLELSCFPQPTNLTETLAGTPVTGGTVERAAGLEVTAPRGREFI